MVVSNARATEDGTAWNVAYKTILSAFGDSLGDGGSAERGGHAVSRLALGNETEVVRGVPGTTVNARALRAAGRDDVDTLFVGGARAGIAWGEYVGGDGVRHIRR